MPLMLRYVARSDVGLVREGNEDSGYAGPYLLAVADGMGGHAAGEVASQAAIEELILAEHDTSDTGPLDTLISAINAANSRIRQLIVDDSSREGMGTTVTAMLWTGTTLGLGHIGDSRAYLVRGDTIRQLTHDHTFVQSLVDEGRITLEEADVHPARSLILKALQGQTDVEPDVELLEVRAGDRILVCSDGLTGVVSDSTLRETLTSVTQLDEAADELVRLALAAGAPDNVTLVLADIIETDNPPHPEDTAEAYLVGAAAHREPAAPERHRRTPGAALRGLLGADEKPTDPDELEAMRYAPQPPRRFRWVRVLIAAAAIVFLSWGALTLANEWVRNQYYVGHSSGEVAIYQGVSQEIGPIRLSELHEIPGGLPVAALPTLYRDQVDETIPADDLEDAQQKVATLRRQACLAHERLGTGKAENPDRTPQPSPEPTRGSSASPSPSAPRTPAGAASQETPRPQPTPSPTTQRTPEPSPTASPDASSEDDWLGNEVGFPGLLCTGSS